MAFCSDSICASDSLESFVWAGDGIIHPANDWWSGNFQRYRRASSDSISQTKPRFGRGLCSARTFVAPQICFGQIFSARGTKETEHSREMVALPENSQCVRLE